MAALMMGNEASEKISVQVITRIYDYSTIEYSAQDFLGIYHPLYKNKSHFLAAQ